MLPKFCVKGDSSADVSFSSSIIISSLNQAAKKLDLYDENGKIVVYSTTADQYGYNADAIMCVYETTLPYPIIQNSNAKPLLGCSLANLLFITSTGYPLASYVPLGVDTKIFKPIEIDKKNKPFRFLVIAESNVRSGLLEIIEAFTNEFPDCDYAELYIKDRGATERFKQYVKENSKKSKIIHDTENSKNIEDVLSLYASADCFVSMHYSSTWNLPAMEAMAMGKPLIGMEYSGMREYLAHGMNGFAVDFRLEAIYQNDIDKYRGLGMRHHMFPVEMHPVAPKWARPYPKDIERMMGNIYTLRNSDIYKELSKNAIETAKQFTWEKSALLLSYALTTK